MICTPNHALIVNAASRALSSTRELPFKHPNPFSLDLGVKLIVKRMLRLVHPRKNVPGVTIVRGGDGVVSEIRKWLLLERVVGVKGVVFMGGVCGVERGDSVVVGSGVVSTWRRSRRWSVVRIPVPREGGKAGNIYLGFLILMDVRSVGWEIVIVGCDSWSRPLRGCVGVIRTRW